MSEIASHTCNAAHGTNVSNAATRMNRRSETIAAGKVTVANSASQVTVVIIPIVALAVMILFLNVVAPSTNDVRVIKYVINVVPQVKGRVTDVPLSYQNFRD